MAGVCLSSSAANDELIRTFGELGPRSGPDLASVAPRAAGMSHQGQACAASGAISCLSMRLRFGVGLPTCREGVAYPVGYVRTSDFARIAQHAEQLGFDSLWANDHLTTPHILQETLDRPPSFYEPLITFAAVAAVTRRVRLVLSVIVVPEREPVLLAKQVATLDDLSDGRVTLGVGIGAYREEFEAVHPARSKANRGALLDEGIAALRCLFEAQSATYEGQYIQFRGVQLAPKPRQQPFPIYVNARGAQGLDRVARTGDGWIASAPTPDALASARADLFQRVKVAGRDPSDISVNVQIWVCTGQADADAEAKLRRSQHFRRLLARDPRRSESSIVDEFRASNLLGSPDRLIDRLHAYEAAGAQHVGLIFLGGTVEQLLDDMASFAQTVLPAFAA
jgi:probable F420-dependent oxidoreductase